MHNLYIGYIGRYVRSKSRVRISLSNDSNNDSNEGIVGISVCNFANPPFLDLSLLSFVWIGGVDTKDSGIVGRSGPLVIIPQ